MRQVYTLEGQNILIASLQSWHSPMISKHFIALELLKRKNNILFLSLEKFLLGRKSNNPETRYHHFESIALTPRKLTLLPGMLRLNLIKWFNKRLIRKTLDGFQPDLILSFDPQYFPLHELYPESVRIYYCVDFLSGNPRMRRAEEAILKISDLVIAASDQLYRDLQNRHESVHHLSHGVNLFKEHEDKEVEALVNRWFTPLKSTIFGFIGRLSENLDFEIIRYVAEKNPSCFVVLVGAHSSKIKDRLDKLPENVICTGPVPSIGIKYCLKFFQVGIVPYRVSQFISRSNPIKIMQYLACGLPVVATQIGEDFSQNDLVLTGHDREHFNAQLIKAIESDCERLRVRRIRHARQNDWESRIHGLEEFIGQHKRIN